MVHRSLAAVIAAVVLLAAAACCCCGGGFDWPQVLDPTAGGSIATLVATMLPTAGPISPPTPVPTIVLTREPAGDAGRETEELLEMAEVPVRDLHELAIRLQGVPADIPRTVNPEGSPDHELGARRLFNVSNVDTDEQFDIYATLLYKTEHVYMWVEEGVQVNQSQLEAAADLFEEETYATNRAFFGSEWSPGVDNDPHVSILHARGLGSSIAGYYSSADEFVKAVRPDSNEVEMFYINIENVRINDSFYNGVLAHEFQHMIHWYNDRNEETWLNEGFSELAMFLNGYDTGGSDWAFAMAPDTQLNTWPEGPGTAGANYGAGYLLTSYFLDRFGAEATQSLVSHEQNGLKAIDLVLEELGAGITHVDLFADWAIANLLDSPRLDDGRYGYAEIDPPTMSIAGSHRASEYPVSVSGTVCQYGTDYIELYSSEPLHFRFMGSTQIGLLDNTAHSGSYQWWSNRGDDSNMMLTQAFDLSSVDAATLEYWAWYDLEEDWDYAYLEISTDGGDTWTILDTPSGTDSNPNGNAFGWGYTGRSGSARPEWIKESIDLSDYAGQEVLIRFEMITDDAVNRPGFTLDDISIPQIGYTSDFEEDGGGWEAAGFVRHANVLPQRWLVQLVLFGRETTVERMVLDDQQIGEWDIEMNDTANRAIVAISGIAPVTTELATYSYEIDPVGESAFLR